MHHQLSFLEDEYTRGIIPWRIKFTQYDGELTATVDCKNVKLRNALTSEEINGYNIWLEASGEFESKDASEEQEKVTVSGFRLEGNDRAKFKLLGEYNNIEKYAYINPAKIFLEKGFENKIKVNSKEFDGSKTAEVDCSEVLNINRSEYDVYLAADREFENENASDDEKKVVIKNFRLEGTDKDNFNFIGEYGEELILTPNEKSIYYGQQRPEFTYTI